MYKHFSFVLNYKLQHASITVLESFEQFIIFTSTVCYHSLNISALYLVRY